MMRIVITGGGTGGHLYPALAVAEALQADVDDVALLYIGNPNKTEAQLVPAHGIRFEGICFSGMPRKLRFSLLGWGFSLLRAFWQSRRLLIQFEADRVFATGGYVTAPVLLAAKSLGIPFVLHEPDAYPGLVNRKMAPWATQMTCAFADARVRLKTAHLTVTGNPLRSDIGRLSKIAAQACLAWPSDLNRPVLLVTGGSQGARQINQAVLHALPHLLDRLGLCVLHQTGEKEYNNMLAALAPKFHEDPRYRVMPFITEMAAALALADIAVCRSGSMSLSEMYRAQIPTILVPYPYAAADHQRKNALASQAAGASVMIEDAQFEGDTLVKTLEILLQNPEQLTGMKQAAGQLAFPEATQTVVRILKSIVPETVS